MAITKTQVLQGVNVKTMSQFVALAGLAMFMPFFIHLQWITGPLVNAILIIALFVAGIRSAMVLCLVPSLMALAGGLLPAVLAPAVPFIMMSNVIFVLTIDYFYTNFKSSTQGFIFGVAVGAFVKFAFLHYSISLVSGLLIKQDLVGKIAQLFSWTQLYSALAGGLIAWTVLKFIKRF